MRHDRLPRIDLSHHSYFLTCCIDKRRPLFRNRTLAEFLINLYAARRDRGKIALHGYVVMPDHYHVLLTLRDENSISGVVRAVHTVFAREYRKKTGLQERLWQRRFYDHVIRDQEDWRTKLSYIHNNPVTAGLAKNILDYPWSSSRFWETGEGPVKCNGWE